MKIIGLLLARNEDWILGLSARAALMWCDSICILDHSSEDHTPRIIYGLDSEYPGRVFWARENDTVWKEMQFRQNLLEMGREVGGTHFALIDADEVLTGNLLPTIRGAVAALQPGQVLEPAMPGLWDGIGQYRGDWNHWTAGAVADTPGLNWRARDGYDFHHRQPFGSHMNGYRPFGRNGGLMHLQFANLRRLRAKQYLYKLIERERWPNRQSIPEINHKYGWWAVGSPTYAAVPESWWKPYQDLTGHLDLDETKEPWQEEECRRMLRRNPSLSTGLDDFGLCLNYEPLSA